MISFLEIHSLPPQIINIGCTLTANNEICFFLRHFKEAKRNKWERKELPPDILWGLLKTFNVKHSRSVSHGKNDSIGIKLSDGFCAKEGFRFLQSINKALITWQKILDLINFPLIFSLQWIWLPNCIIRFQRQFLVTCHLCIEPLCLRCV